MGVQKSDLPFKEGQHVESRSFQEGFRGSWFRSKIHSIRRRPNNDLGCKLKFLDFPDEKLTWTKIYQKPQTNNKQQNQELMVRPCFPRVYRESQMPEVNAISEAIVVFNDVLRVGNLIDWWKDDCYWSGKITQILKDDKFQIELLPPPLGEGASYEASLKDMRPSIDWSLEHGWTVPSPKDGDLFKCARIIQPTKQGKIPSLPSRGEERGDVQGTEIGVRKRDLSINGALESPIISPKLPLKVNSGTEIGVNVKTSGLDSDSLPRFRKGIIGTGDKNGVLEDPKESPSLASASLSLNGDKLATMGKQFSRLVSENAKFRKRGKADSEKGEKDVVNQSVSRSESIETASKIGDSEVTSESHSLASSNLPKKVEKLGSLRLVPKIVKFGRRDRLNLEKAVKDTVDQGATVKTRPGSVETQDRSDSPSLAPSRLIQKEALKPSGIDSENAKVRKRGENETQNEAEPSKKMRVDQKMPTNSVLPNTIDKAGSIEKGSKISVAKDRSELPSLASSSLTKKLDNLGTGNQPSGSVPKEAAKPSGINLENAKVRKRGEYETDKEVNPLKKMKADPKMASSCDKEGSTKKGSEAGVAKEKSESPSLGLTKKMDSLGTTGKQASDSVAKEAAKPLGINSKNTQVPKENKIKIEKEANPSKMPLNSMLHDMVKPSVVASGRDKEGSIEQGNKTGVAKEMTGSPSLASSSTIYRVDKMGIMRKQTLENEAEKEEKLSKFGSTETGNNTVLELPRSVLENRECKERGETEKEIRRNCMFSDTVESSVIDLEELLCMIKWMKGVLRADKTSQPPWKFLGHRASSTPR